MSELMQLESAISTSRYLPPSGTAGFERCCVSGKRRLPAPPPRMTANNFGSAGMSQSLQTVERLLVRERSRRDGFVAGGFLRDLHSDTRADASRARFDHLARVFESFHTARSFHAEFVADGAPHQRDVGGGGAPFRKPRRWFPGSSARFFLGR